MNRSEFKKLNEDWNKYLQGKYVLSEEIGDETLMSIAGEPKKKIVQSYSPAVEKVTSSIARNIDCFPETSANSAFKEAVWDLVGILDPSPVSGLIDLGESVQDFYNKPDVWGALEVVWNGVTLIPGLNIAKKFSKIAEAKKALGIIAKANKAYNVIEKGIRYSGHALAASEEWQRCSDRQKEEAMASLDKKIDIRDDITENGDNIRIKLNPNSRAVAEYGGSIMEAIKNRKMEHKKLVSSITQQIKEIEVRGKSGNVTPGEGLEQFDKPVPPRENIDVVNKLSLDLDLGELKKLANSIAQYLNVKNSDDYANTRKTKVRYIKRLNKLAKKIEKSSNSKISFDEARKIINKNYWSGAHSSKRRLLKIKNRILKKFKARV
jgi:hypothetical protein